MLAGGLARIGLKSCSCSKRFSNELLGLGVGSGGSFFCPLLPLPPRPDGSKQDEEDDAFASAFQVVRLPEL